MPRNANTLEFAPEELESRQMLAGDISVVKRHSDLVITGDNKAVVIHIIRDAYGRTGVAGPLRTRMNGAKLAELIEDGSAAVAAPVGGEWLRLTSTTVRIFKFRTGSRALLRGAKHASGRITHCGSMS